ncbi:MAG: ferrochelatase [Chloroflexi bacterium]|nr:ferrochelatase [Chloroflexota bacterium]
MTKTAVLLLAFGGPASLDEVGPFMSRLMGRQPSPQVVERVVERYRLIGGGSPLPGIARELAEALSQRLAGEGVSAVGFGFKYTDPTISDAVRGLAQSGHGRIVGVSLSAHYTRVSTGAYFEELRAAGQANGVEVVVADSYHAEPRFVDGIAAQACVALANLSDGEDAFLVFSAHSVPVEYIEAGDPYVEQLQATVDSVLALVPGHDWRLAFQSRGMGQGNWLEPTVETVLEELASTGKTKVVLVPVGFTLDHVETLYDIDILIAGKARGLGLEFARAGVLNASAPYIEALAAVVRPRLILEADDRAEP